VCLQDVLDPSRDEFVLELGAVLAELEVSLTLGQAVPTVATSF
jgi:hypothetical protein